MYQKKAVLVVLLASMVAFVGSCAELGLSPKQDLLANGLSD